jgi:NAD-dependent SIR2 family protein deacetylase
VGPDDPRLDEMPGRLWVWYCAEDDTVAKASCTSSEYFDGASCPACGETMLGPYIYRLIRPARWFTGQRGKSTEHFAALELPEPFSKAGNATGRSGQ